MRCVLGQTVYTGRAMLKRQYVAFDGQKVVGVFPARKGELIGEFPVVTPAFIDAHSHIGIHRSGEPGAAGESNEYMDTILVLSDVLDSIQMDDKSFRTALEQGVLYSCVLPGSLNLIGGRSAVIRHYSKNSSDALIARAGIKAALGWNPMSGYEKKGQRGSTRMGNLAILRQRYGEVRRKIEDQKKARGRKKDDVTFSDTDAVIRDLLQGRERLRVHAHKTDDISSLLRLVDEFKLRVSVEHAMDVDQPEIFRELKKRGIPVVYGPLDIFPSKVELLHKDWRNVRHLMESGVTFGLMTDHPVIPSWNLFLQTRWFLRAGMSRQQAVELVTRKNAEFLGLEKTLGTLEKGRWASFIGWSGDPFALDSHPAEVYGEGQRLHKE